MAHFSSEYQIKQRVHRMLLRRFFLRFHVTLILVWTFVLGLLTTKGLLVLGVESMAVRYGLAVLLAYLGFLFGVRVWLWYVGLEVRGTDRHDDAFDAASNGVPSGSRNAPAEAVRPGGGSFGGGGASGDYTVDPALATELLPTLHSVESASGVVESGSGAAESVLEGVVAADEAAIPLAVVALIVAALMLVVGAGAYVVIDAPAVLVEAAFEAMLAGGLIRATRRVDDPDWSVAVIRMTWLPALVTLLGCIAFALAVQHYRPEVHTLVQLWNGS